MRNDSQSRRREGLEVEEPEVASGGVPTRVAVRENGVLFLVDPWQGQKTGFFLDQRDKREALRKYAAHADRILNCFSYTGGFSVYVFFSNLVVQITRVVISSPAIWSAPQQF